MGQKWTDEQRTKFKATMAAKHMPKITVVEDIGPRRKRRSPNEAEEFARFIGAAWRAYKGRS
jgi:hypothetical protein